MAGDSSRVEEAVSLYNGGCNCSQAILSAYGEPLGIPRETALRLACGFGGGMRQGDTCGAVAGAFMAIGLKYGPTLCQGGEAKKKTYRLTREFAARFKARNGSVMCRDLLGCDIATPEGVRRAEEQKLFSTLCPKMVREAAEILDALFFAHP